MNRSAKHRRIARLALSALALVLAVAIADGTARAWFVPARITGGGTAQVAVAPGLTATPVQIVSDLRPGGTADLSLALRNTGTAPVRIDALLLDTSRGVGGFASDQPACTSPDLAYAAQRNGGAGWTVPARVGGVDGQLRITLAGALAMGMAAGSSCQGAGFTVYLVAG